MIILDLILQREIIVCFMIYLIHFEVSYTWRSIVLCLSMVGNSSHEKTPPFPCTTTSMTLAMWSQVTKLLIIMKPSPIT